MSDIQKIITNTLSTVVAVQILSLIAFTGFFFVLHSDLASLKESVSKIQTGQQPQSAPERIDDWLTQIRPHDATMGAKDAKVTFIEYSDFQCPFCKTFNDTTRARLVEKYGDSVKFVYKHFPLEAIHKEAVISAIGAECAKKENKFWEFHDALFSRQESLSKELVLILGNQMTLGESFMNCVNNEETKAQVVQDQSDALEAGIVATPTFVINGAVLQGNQPLASFENIIDSLL